MTLEVREAHTADAEVVCDLARRTFVAAFADDNRPQDMDDYVADTFTVDRIREALVESASTFLLAFDAEYAQDRPVGYAQLRTGPADDCVSGQRPLELVRLYIEPEAIGGGRGGALMQRVLERARASGHQTLWLGVWEHNQGAIRFYRRWGFEDVGSHDFQLGADRQTDRIMQRPVELG